MNCKRTQIITGNSNKPIIDNYLSMHFSPRPHTPTAEGELQLASGSYFEELMDIFQKDLINWFGEVVPSSPKPPLSPTSPESPLVPSSSPASPGSLLVPSSSLASPKLPVTPKLPPSLPLPPPLKPASSSALSPLVAFSPSAHPQLSASGLPVSSSA